MRYAIRYMKLTKNAAMVRNNDPNAVELAGYELAGLAPSVPRKGEWFCFRGPEEQVIGPVKEVVTILTREDGTGEHPSGPRCVIEVYILPRELL